MANVIPGWNAPNIADVLTTQVLRGSRIATIPAALNYLRARVHARTVVSQCWSHMVPTYQRTAVLYDATPDAVWRIPTMYDRTEVRVVVRLRTVGGPAAGHSVRLTAVNSGATLDLASPGAAEAAAATRPTRAAASLGVISHAAVEKKEEEAAEDEDDEAAEAGAEAAASASSSAGGMARSPLAIFRPFHSPSLAAACAGLALPATAAASAGVVLAGLLLLGGRGGISDWPQARSASTKSGNRSGACRRRNASRERSRGSLRGARGPRERQEARS